MIGVALLLVGGCGAPEPIMPPEATAPLEITDRANGQTLRLQVGQELVLNLSECGSCGYKWTVTERPPVLAETAKADLGSDNPEASGASANIQYIFRAERAGTGRLVLKNIFPPRVTEGPTLTFNVEVR